MKVINSINYQYQNCIDLHEMLEDRVDELINGLKENTWHYFKRIKKLESFALKIETGRFTADNIFEDFFACTIVVENSSEINNAIEKIEKFFTICHKKPENNEITTNSPEMFRFDDLRLYVKMTPGNGLPKGPLHDLIFEIQIKTFLQHAWTLATHDMIYKSDEISWAKQRIAYQIKAMLEHAEISIKEIEQIKKSNILFKENKEIKNLNKVKEFILKNWNRDLLPRDYRRISENISNLLHHLKISVEEIQDLLDSETKMGRGTKILDLSPYFIIIKTIIDRNPDKLKEFCSDSNSKGKIVIPLEFDIASLELDKSKIIHF